MKFKEWRYEKHLTNSDMKNVIAKADKRAREDGKETVFFRQGALIPATKIRNFKKRKAVRELETTLPSVGKNMPARGHSLELPADSDITDSAIRDAACNHLLYSTP